MFERLYFTESRENAQAVIYRLLDAEEDAFDPRAELDRLIPNRCPDCGGNNLTEPDDEGLIDCLDCGIWFNPFHPANSPTIPGNYPDPDLFPGRTPKQEGLEDEISDLKSYALRHGAKPFGYVLKSRIKHVYGGKEYPTRYPWLNARAMDFRQYIGDATVFKHLSTTRKWPDLEVVPVYSNPRQTGERAFNPLGESLDDEIRDLKAYAMLHGLPPRIKITFDRTTPESVENGDYSESGWENEEGVLMAPDEFDRQEGITAVDNAVNYLWVEGATEPSSSKFSPGIWYSTDFHTTNYQTGEQEERSFHLEGFTETQEKEIYDKLRGKLRQDLKTYTVTAGNAMVQVDGTRPDAVAAEAECRLLEILNLHCGEDDWPREMIVTDNATGREAVFAFPERQ